MNFAIAICCCCTYLGRVVIGGLFAEGLQDASHALALATGGQFLANRRVLVLACKIECHGQRRGSKLLSFLLRIPALLSRSLSKTDQVTHN